MTRYHELRIVLPLSIEEYQIGHMYTRYKLKHRPNQRSETELYQCIPYQNDIITTQLIHNLSLYTHHIHLFNGSLPQWVLTMLNGSQFKIHGKTWDEFPYITSKYELPSIARANIQIDYQHFDNDIGNQQNVFHLTPTQLSKRTIQYCDICFDPSIDGQDTDPKLYKYTGSLLPQRGPLQVKTVPTSSTTMNSPPSWHNQCKQKICVYVLLSATFDLPLVRNLAIDLAISHFTQIVVELHRLSYIWLHEWDQYVITKPQLLLPPSQLSKTISTSNQPQTSIPISSSQLLQPNDTPLPTTMTTTNNSTTTTTTITTPTTTNNNTHNDNNNNNNSNTTTTPISNDHPHIAVLNLFMKDATHNPQLTSTNPPKGPAPLPPLRIIQTARQLNQQPPKRGLKGFLPARL